MRSIWCSLPLYRCGNDDLTHLSLVLHSLHPCLFLSSLCCFFSHLLVFLLFLNIFSWLCVGSVGCDFLVGLVGWTAQSTNQMANVPKSQTRVIDIMKDTTLRQLQCMNTRTHEILLLNNTLKFSKVARRFADSRDVPQLTRNGATFTLKQ